MSTARRARFSFLVPATSDSTNNLITDFFAASGCSRLLSRTVRDCAPLSRGASFLPSDRLARSRQ